MVIIRVNAHITAADMEIVTQEIHAQAETGVIVLPPWCELLNEVPNDEEIQILPLIDARVAEFRREVAQALADLSKAHTCETCKHEPIDPYECFETGYACNSCNEPSCVCRDCDEGSRWEWRHARDRE